MDTETINVDGQDYPVNKLPDKVIEANSSGKKLVEISPGVFKTLDRIKG